MRPAVSAPNKPTITSRADLWRSAERTCPLGGSAFGATGGTLKPNDSSSSTHSDAKTTVVVVGSARETGSNSPLAVELTDVQLGGVKVSVRQQVSDPLKNAVNHEADGVFWRADGTDEARTSIKNDLNELTELVELLEMDVNITAGTKLELRQKLDDMRSQIGGTDLDAQLAELEERIACMKISAPKPTPSSNTAPQANSNNSEIERRLKALATPAPSKNNVLRTYGYGRDMRAVGNCSRKLMQAVLSGRIGDKHTYNADLKAGYIGATAGVVKEKREQLQHPSAPKGSKRRPQWKRLTDHPDEEVRILVEVRRLFLRLWRNETSRRSAAERKRAQRKRRAPKEVRQQQVGVTSRRLKTMKESGSRRIKKQ